MHTALTGRVTDAASGLGAGGVRIEVWGGGSSLTYVGTALTQPDGSFTLELRAAPPKPPARDVRTAEPVVANDGDELASLTPREREVLRLLAKGLSNRQIAEALYIAPRTASTHVGNILGKLGLSSRTEAATRALRRGLSPTSHNNGGVTAI